MKTYVTLVVLFLTLSSFGSKDLLNKPMPVLPEKTLDGKAIDANYFKGHVTIVTFMFIGCFHCLEEINLLNRLKKEYANEPRLQILCIAANSEEHMKQFNADSGNVYTMLRKAKHAEQMSYDVQPACAVSTEQLQGNVLELSTECKMTEDVYGVISFPTIFFVDKDGVIRDIRYEGPKSNTDTVFYNELSMKVDGMVKGL